MALRRARCPKDRGHILETAQPDVVCSKCGTQYILATKVGLLTLRQELIEKPPVVAPSPQPAPSSMGPGKFCHKCGSVLKPEASFCSSCGTAV